MNDRHHPFRRPMPPRDSNPYDGVLVVDKPSGPTSHDVVDRIRRTFRIEKAGHGGTLDPQATGLLVILLGRGTKLSGDFISSDKTYEGVMRLGVETTTHDLQGEVVREGDWSSVTRERLEAELRSRTGDLYQIPPMVSAIKVNGVPLYKRARKGETVEREPRLIHIYEFTLLGFRPPQVDFRVRCTKGTYVRTLCSDIGEALGCGACLEQLRRTTCGDIRIEEATPLDQLLAMSREDLGGKVIPLSRFRPRP